MNHIAIWVYVTLFLFGLASPVMAEQGGWLSSALTWTQDLAAQTTTMQALSDPEKISRTGIETGAGFAWSKLDYQGGYSVGIQGSYDKGFESNVDISEAGLSINAMRSLSLQWLTRFTGHASHYRNEAFPNSGYDALGAEMTLGYFGGTGSGLDLKLGLTGENHNQDPSNRYRTNRSYTEAIGYLPHEKTTVKWEMAAHLESNNADNPRFDYSSIRLRVGFKGWQAGQSYAALSLQWQKDNYNSHSTSGLSSSTSRPIPGYPGGMGQGNMTPVNSGFIPSTQKRRDTLLFLTLQATRPISKKWQLILFGDLGRYRSEPIDNDRKFYDIAITSRWVFN